MNLFIQKTNLTSKSSSKNIVEAFLLNSRSPRKHHEELEVMIGNLESRPAIIGITETWLDKTDLASCYKIKGYDTVLSKTRQSKGGGVMLQFAKEIEFIEDHTCSLEESLLVEFRLFGNQLLVLILYNPPRTNKFWLN